MIVRTLSAATGTSRDVDTPTWRSRRLLRLPVDLDLGLNLSALRLSSDTS